MAYACLLLRETEPGNWMQREGITNLEIFTFGLIIRDLKTAVILNEFPITTIKCIEWFGPGLFRVSLKAAKAETIAVKLSNIDKEAELAQRLKALGVEVVDTKSKSDVQKKCLGFALPNLNNKQTQEVILMLLLSEEFEVFTAELEMLLETMKSKII